MPKIKETLRSIIFIKLTVHSGGVDHFLNENYILIFWIPAFAGMTVRIAINPATVHLFKIDGTP
jgi:hypothetical protein